MSFLSASLALSAAFALAPQDDQTDPNAFDRAAESMAVNSYNQAVRNSIAEVDAAIRLDTEQRARRDAVRTQSEAARLAYEESVERYLAGLDTYLSVLAAQAANQAADLALLQARRDAVSARIQLHDALGQLGDR